MKIIPLVLLAALVASCAQKENKSRYRNGLIISDNDYILSVNGKTDSFKTVARLNSTLEKTKPAITQDTLFIYIKNTTDGRIIAISKMLRKLHISKYQYVVTNEFFTLP
jgi:hypothetical protein